MSTRLPDLGPRGEGWVVAQFVLFAAIAGAGFRDLVGHDSWGPIASLAGVIGIVAGGLVALRGASDLRASFSPFPRPVAKARLVESGAYRLIRHPIYSGLVLASIGWGLVASSVLALALSAFLFLFFAAKSRREEAWLAAIHPVYDAYRRRTKRLIPWVY